MDQSSVIAGALLIAFLIIITNRNELSQYLDVFTGKAAGGAGGAGGTGGTGTTCPAGSTPGLFGTNVCIPALASY